ncbi:pyruvate kinase [Desulforhopalus singaporensis]|uniref:Pyruvate kinase n=1 Tax=Desulforhopalus singaporensis TaxID=91360 RepID=A0A1H0UHQ5_9BACT|nr:pyruvate kinase [Desulforhopalus singaporensis]SDP65822.1 pyruvate kinase [Desulforhopalus singaporensis]
MTKTKIIATLGPSTGSVDSLVALIEAGMNVARINLSHGDRQSHRNAIDQVKQARKAAGSHTAILLDTRGPEIRVGDLAQPLEISAGQTLVITTDQDSCGADRIGVNYPGLASDVAVGTTILLDDGKLRLQVVDIRDDDVISRVMVGGVLTRRKRVSIPDTIVKLPSLSDKDKSDIAFGVVQGVDFIAASFVRKADDIWAVREIIEDNGGNQAIIAKIENRQGVDNLDEILEAAEGLMVARGDLGVELPAEEVPVLQKKIIQACNRSGKPVITATQMLESMVTSPSPTRAEASDVTNAIFDGTDAVMLSAETAVGKYPVQAIEFLARCANISEASLDYETILATGLKNRRKTITDAISYACCRTAADLGARAIITCTTSGSTARMVARHRPEAPIIAVSPNMENLRQLQVVRGVITLHGAAASTMDQQLDLACNIAREKGFIHHKDLVVISAGMPIGTTGTTNMLKVRQMADICFTGQGCGGGVAEGRIHIISSHMDLKTIPEGAIAVVSGTDDDILDHIRKIRGIIAETPGLTTHAAIIGREHNIPVICNVRDARTLLANGQTVTIDGNSGRISYGAGINP